MILSSGEEMKTVNSFKMTYQSHHFNKNQRVWVVNLSGSMAAECYGRFRGKGRYIRAWVHWGSENKPIPSFQEFEVDDDFANQIYYS
jgi:hypothetical protein